MQFDQKDAVEESIDLSHFVLQNRIGQGSYSKVYKIKEKNTGEIFAAKVSIEETDFSSNEQIINLSREVAIISKLNHPSILNFKGFSPVDFKKRSRAVIITEYASNGSLEDLLKSERQTSQLDFTQKLIIIYGIASAMSYLHLHNIIHRDLKPANILIDKFLFPKIADFGLSKIKHTNFESMTMKSVIGCVKGTPIYMSPEIWQKAEYNKPSDVYAFAIIVYEIVTNEKPYEGLHLFEILLKVKEGYRPEFKKDIPDSYKNLITSCWNADPLLRPTFDTILDQLKNDSSFITEKVNEDKYRKYIKYIDEFRVSFDEFKMVDLFSFYSRIENHKKEINDYFSMKSHIYPFNEFIQLDERCKQIVIEAENKPEN